ncbi:MAG: hypothetical protein EOP11_26145, partial [Proteobacteria bacterium]
MKQKHLCRLMALTLATTVLSLASAFAAPAGGTGGNLKLEDFIGQVESKDPTLKSAHVGTEAYTLLRDSGKLLTMPNLTANVYEQTNRDEPQTSFQARRTDTSTYSVGLAMNTDFGLSGKYS